jgi:hypothetical protein
MSSGLGAFQTSDSGYSAPVEDPAGIQLFGTDHSTKVSSVRHPSTPNADETNLGREACSLPDATSSSHGSSTAAGHIADSDEQLVQEDTDAQANLTASIATLSGGDRIDMLHDDFFDFVYDEPSLHDAQ